MIPDEGTASSEFPKASVCCPFHRIGPYPADKSLLARYGLKDPPPEGAPVLDVQAAGIPGSPAHQECPAIPTLKGFKFTGVTVGVGPIPRYGMISRFITEA